jgi:hypothetical protein
MVTFIKSSYRFVFLVDGHAKVVCCLGNKFISLRYLEKVVSMTSRSSSHFDVKIKIGTNIPNFFVPYL